jgi:hypothetical protein
VPDEISFTPLTRGPTRGLALRSMDAVSVARPEALGGRRWTTPQAPDLLSLVTCGVDRSPGVMGLKEPGHGETSDGSNLDALADESAHTESIPGVTQRRTNDVASAAGQSMSPSGGGDNPRVPLPVRSASALLLLYQGSVTGGRDQVDRSGAGIMIRWEYAHLSAGFDGVTQQWSVTMRVPGREMEKRSVTGVGWISQILNELGHEGWELISRDATGTSGNDFVTGWQFILKRPGG